VIELVVFALVVETGGSFGVLFSQTETFESDLVGEARVKIVLHVGEVDAIVGSLRARKRTLN